MLAQSSILAVMETSLKTLFWCIGILEGRRTIGQDILESMIYESSTVLKLASELLIDLRIQKYMLHTTYKVKEKDVDQRLATLS